MGIWEVYRGVGVLGYDAIHVHRLAQQHQSHGNLLPFTLQPDLLHPSTKILWPDRTQLHPARLPHQTFLFLHRQRFQSHNVFADIHVTVPTLNSIGLHLSGFQKTLLHCDLERFAKGHASSIQRSNSEHDLLRAHWRRMHLRSSLVRRYLHLLCRTTIQPQVNCRGIAGNLLDFLKGRCALPQQGRTVRTVCLFSRVKINDAVMKWYFIHWLIVGNICFKFLFAISSSKD